MHNCKISSHSQWQPLQEVWIGGTYPESFYSHLGSKSHDVFAKITEITHQDFDKLAAVLTNLGVTVVRPRFDRIEHFLDHHDNLLKPPVSPCDIALTLGDTLHVMPQYSSGHCPYQHALDRYRHNNQKIHTIDRSTPESWAWVIFASVVRAGRDIFIDYLPNHEQSKQSALAVAQDLAMSYRVHLSSTGDHHDGVFCPLKPGHIFTSHYRSVYAESFPDWSVYHLPPSNLKTGYQFELHNKWYVPGIDFGHFNQEVLAVAENWLGHPQETVWQVNMLVVDEHNIICGIEDERAFKFFENIGMTPHVVEFKSNRFWDAGIHCVTSDIYRLGDREDYWPDRGPNGVYNITEW